MKDIKSAEEIMAVVKAKEEKIPCDWVIDLIAKTSQAMYDNGTRHMKINVPYGKEVAFRRTYPLDKVSKVLRSKGLIIHEGDYGSFFLHCR